MLAQGCVQACVWLDVDKLIDVCSLSWLMAPVERLLNQVHPVLGHAPQLTYLSVCYAYQLQRSLRK